MKSKRRSEDQMLPFHTIDAATRGDAAALTTVLDHFSGYIATLATRTLYDEYGMPCQFVDQELKRQLETRLIVGILKFKVA